MSVGKQNPKAVVDPGGFEGYVGNSEKFGGYFFFKIFTLLLSSFSPRHVTSRNASVCPSQYIYKDGDRSHFIGR